MYFETGLDYSGYSNYCSSEFYDVLLSESSITGRSDAGKTEQEKGVRKRWRLDMQRTNQNPVNTVISGMKRKRNVSR